ncbi:MAG: FAD-binding protein, partial [Rhodobiaceae bacterium]|nr:FAD-binding protein [Rhodobiaceae bacterium]
MAAQSVQGLSARRPSGPCAPARSAGRVSAFRPETEEALAAFVADAAAKAQPLEIRGGGTRRGLGRPVQAAETIDMSALSGITLYEPSELVIAAKAGTPLAEIEAALAEHGQHLAFEPMDHGPLFGTDGAAATIGAVAACNISGPRRIMAG